MLAVLLYHTDIDQVRGGFLGVDVFFVLSGFLITHLLLQEHARDGKIGLQAFYLRRIRRLLPALYGVLLFVSLAAVFFLPDVIRQVRDDLVWSLLYLANWWFIYSEQSYFEAWVRPPFLQHLWSLAIEEQFYAFWPLVVIAALRWTNRRALGFIALAGAVASTGWMAWMAFQRDMPANDASRAYFGTDTHVMGLLLGASLAAAYDPHAVQRQSRAWWPRVGMMSFAGLLASFVLLPEHSPLLYQGGFAAVSLLTVLVIYTTTSFDSQLSRVLSSRWMRWIGDRSYGLYLWHWPILLMTRPLVDVPYTGVTNVAFRLAVTTLVAQVSYVLIETPFRRGRLGQRTSLTLLAGSAAVAFAVVALAPAPITATVPKDVAEAMGIHGGGSTSVGLDDQYRRQRALEVVAAQRRQAELESLVCRHVPASEMFTSTFASSLSAPVVVASSRPPAARIEGDPFSALATGAPYRVTVLGDSVILGARQFIERRIASARTDAAVGRQAVAMVKRIEELRSASLLAPKVVLHLGSNGVVTSGQLRSMLDLLVDRERVILVNAVAPRRWVDDNNDVLASASADYPNAVVADWNLVAESHPEYFVSDQVHLSVSGQRALVDGILRVGAFSAEDFTQRAPGPRVIPWTPAPDAPPLHKLKKPRALDSFWDLMARCETGSNWKDPGQFAGGLGIYVGTWRMFGGLEFAGHPTEASREQQIEIANRVSTQGWQKSEDNFVEPVGFSGWGCLKVTGAPALVEHLPSSIAAQKFEWGHSGPVVRDLQRILGLRADGVYGTDTWTAHLQYLKTHGLSIDLAPK